MKSHLPVLNKMRHENQRVLAPLSSPIIKKYHELVNKYDYDPLFF